MLLDRRNCFLAVLLKYYLISVSASGADSKRDHYTAAVVEYYRTIKYDAVQKVDAEATLNINTQYYLEVLQCVRTQITVLGLPPLDIIVYPESTLYVGFTNADYLKFGTLVPTAADKKAPCDDDITYKKFLSDLSCASRENSTYMVVNVVEQEACTEEQRQDETCAQHGFNLYNTNVVFDREGIVVAKYRKFNLFKEPVNTTDYAENVIFTTDFGVTFGTFTCFDIMFPNPALELVEMGIKHFIFPSMWFSELPFLVSVQAQEMWARENDAVLLASGALNPDNGSGGSGIYQGSYGALENILTAEKGNQHFILQEVPKEWVPKPEISDPRNALPSTKADPENIISLDNFKLILDNNTEYTSEPLNTEVESHSTTICSTASGFENGDLPEGELEQFCCEFIIMLEAIQWPGNIDKDFYHYRMFAYSGVRSFTGAYNGGLEVCGLVACTDSQDRTTCGKRFPDASNIKWPIIFSKIVIQANFTKSTKRAQFPNSLRWNLKSIPATETDWAAVDNSGSQPQVLRTHQTLLAQTELLTFGIYGRDFARDSDPNNGGDAGGGQGFITLVVVFVMVFLSVMFNFHSMY